VKVLEDWKIRVSVLWLFVIVSDLTNIVMSLSYPGTLEELETYAETMGPELMLAGAVVALIPLVMAVLTLTLEGSINRWLNIISGVVFTLIFFGSAIELATSMPAAHIQLLSVAGIIASALIVWFAWKSKPRA